MQCLYYPGTKEFILEPIDSTFRISYILGTFINYLGYTSRLPKKQRAYKKPLHIQHFLSFQPQEDGLGRRLFPSNWNLSCLTEQIRHKSTQSFPFSQIQKGNPTWRLFRLDLYTYNMYISFCFILSPAFRWRKLYWSMSSMTCQIHFSHCAQHIVNVWGKDLSRQVFFWIAESSTLTEGYAARIMTRKNFLKQMVAPVAKYFSDVNCQRSSKS